MVCFVNGKPAKSQYRHFNVKTVVGPDDFATMEEVVYRRYKRVMDENPALLPQLIVIDGGKGQLSAAVKSLKKLELHDKIPILGIAKNLEELFFPNDPVPLHLDKKSITLRIIQQLRDEAHRFGITHHRNQRSKQTLTTQLTDIEGIGEIISKKLLTKYKSVNAIKALDFATLKTEIGEKRANALRTYFDESEKNV
jgi:excinuclease ABC subunit C